MLVGREGEQVRITAMLDQARAGRSGALVVRGEAGSGKTALLESAAADDFAILRTQAVETEAEIAFAGLHDLLRPILDARARLPGPQAEALAVALNITSGPQPERLAISAGTLGVLAIASESSPILAIIDDAHLLDRASADAIGFAARRLRDERVAVLLAIRDGEPSTFVTDGIAELRLEPLDDSAAGVLLDRSNRHLTTEARARVLALAQGNPLAILELPDWIESESQLGSPEPAMRSSSLITRAFGRRIERLPQETRNALTLAAANDDDDLGTILRACSVVGIVPDSFAPAEQVGAVAIDTDTLRFRHPLVRAVAYASATPAERRDAHRALATALVDRRTEARWAWHRALAAVGPDETAAAALEAVAEASNSASARARALEQAARLSIDAPSRTRRLIAAALSAEEAGRLRMAESLAEDVRRGSLDATQRADVDHLLGRIWTRDGQITKAVDVLTSGAAAVADLDPDRAARMLADAVDAAIDDLERAEPIANEAVELIRADPATEQLVMLRMGDVLGWKGDAPKAAAAWRRSADLADPDDAWSLRLAAEALFSAGMDDDAVSIAHKAAELSRARGQFNALTQSLDFVALADARRGRLLDALDAATEALDLDTALGQLGEEMSSAGTVAWINALLGREIECRAHLVRVTELSARTGHPGPHRPALGVLELAMGRPDVAAAVMLENVADPDRLGADAIAPCSFVPSLIEALVRSNRAAEAVPIAFAYGAVADQSDLPRAQALALRCRGLADGNVEDLQKAIEMHDAMGNGYEVARTQLCLGEMLRRRGKRMDARAPLKAALDSFDDTGAPAWAERARTELELSGVAVRRGVPSTSLELTPQERNVARLVATGLTNREISERLFVTENTVETHLRHIFQKLDVTSRTQLVIAVGGRESAARPALVE